MDYKYILYSGEHCHLCDLAMDIIQQHTSNILPDMAKQSITGDHQLMHLYGARIPVLKRCDNRRELEWPFNHIELLEFLS